MSKWNLKKNWKWFLLLIPVIAVVCVVVALLAGDTSAAASALEKQLTAEGDATIYLDGNVKVSKEIVIKGNKVIKGNGTIVLADELGEWSKDDSKDNAWGMGCAALELKDTDNMTGILVVSDGASLTLGENAVIDAASKDNAILLAGKSQLVITEEAVIKNGRYANIIVNKDATLEVKGGTIADGEVHGIINKGTLTITDGTLSGGKKGAIVYSMGTTTQSGGTIEGCKLHNVYVGAGTFTMTGGVNEGAAKDAIAVAEGATVKVEDGEILNCNHGICNNGDTEVGKITLSECGIMNYKTGSIVLNDTKVDTAAVYCLANNGGTVVANNFTAAKCDTCAIYNFSGDMELNNVTITGSRDGNIANAAGNLVVNGGKLEECNDKSIVVGNGEAHFHNVTLSGTSREKYGVYVFGGKMYMDNSTLHDISSSAFKVDAGGYIEIKDITMKDIAQNAFQLDGGEVVAENITMENLGSHGVYNNGGAITLTNATITGIKKNAVQQKGGETTLVKVSADTIGNHGGYVEKGTLSVSESTFKNMEGNGFYLVNGENELSLKDVVIDTTGDQGINNQSKVTAENLTISNTARNGIYNKENGVVTAKNVTITNTGDHGISNVSTMTITDLSVDKTGKEKNNVQNTGTLTISNAVLLNSDNHGLYNTGKLTGSEIIVKNAGKNGVYNAEGTLNIAGVSVDGTKEHGINNAATLVLSKVTVTNTGAEKNCIQNSGNADITSVVLTASKNHGIYNTGTLVGKDVTVKNSAVNGIYNTAGSITVNGLSIDGAGEHGINNEATLTVINVSIANTGADKNCIQNSGTASVSTALLKDSKNHGIYNKGTLKGSDITVTNPAKNGVYNDKGTVDSINKLMVTNAGNHAVNNNGKFILSDLTVDKPVQNGIYNSDGTMTADKVTITNTGEHSVNNDGTLTLTNATLSLPGEGKNCIQNTGVMTANEITIKDSINHGIYNNGTLNSTGKITVTDIAQNGIYNYGGKMNVATVEISNTVSHGLNNTGELTVKTLAIENVEANSIQNSGSMLVSGSAVITESGKHGLYNSKQFVGNNISIKNAGDLGLSNAGNLEIRGLDISGKASKSVYNNGYAEIYKATIDGTDVSNTEAEYLVDNNGGILDLNDTTIKNAKGTAIHNRGNASTSVTNVVINTAGNYGTFIEAGSSLSGDGFEINNITKGFDGAEGMPIKNAGKITMLDHVTIGSDASEVTGSGAEAETTLGNIVNNAIVNDAATATYSGYDLVVDNATAGCAIYNKGVVFVTDFAADKPKDGLVSRYNSWITLSGNINITNASRNPVTTYGAESGNYKNGVTLTSGSDMTIDGAANHAINNKGSFLAAADSNVTVKNVIGQNINAINNNKGTMTLGKVVIDNVRTTITMYNDTTINSNCGNAIQTSGKLTLDGAVTISNIYYDAANDKTDNSNGSGVVVKNGGSIDGNGSITINGNAADGDYAGLFNGIFTTKCVINIAGDIVVDTVSNQGIYVADANASLKAGNITLSNIGGNGIYINNASGKLVSTGTIKATDMTKGRGLNNAGVVETVNLEISGVTGYAGIENSKTITATGDVTVKNVTNGPGIRNKGTITVNGTTTITDISGSKTNGIQQDGGKTMNLNNVVISNISSTVAGANYCNGIHNKGTINLSGTATISNITNSAATADTEGNGIINAEAGRTITGTGSIVIDTVQRNGIYNLGTITVKDISVSNAGVNGVWNFATVSLSGNMLISNIAGMGLYIQDGSGVVEVKNLTINTTGNHAVWINNGNGRLEVAETISIDTAGARGLYTRGTVTAKNVRVFNTAKAAVRMDAHSTGNGNITVTEDIVVNTTTSEQGVYLNGSGTALTVRNIVVNEAAADAVKNSSGTLTVSGTITVDGAVQ